MKARFFLIITIGFFLSINQFSATAENNKLDWLTKIAAEEELAVKQWQVVLKEQINAGQAKEIARKIETVLPASDFKIEETEVAEKIKITNLHKSSGIAETFIMVKPKQEEAATQISYSVKGNAWNEQAKSYYSSKLGLVTNELFTESYKEFSCISLQTNGKINSVYFFEKFVEKLDVQTLDEIQEKDFTVLSGYTPIWEETIPGKDSLMNIQIAARGDVSGNTTITIGTPIIITEY
ncbi:YwmB family TATA-box binding protein [Sediminibacillus albus]|uniref:TATA-box binding n=1 Tax=Sediminibacillus albus TaxID=407036 RepID=A0A1G8ZIN2_9BACI|nr:YwmB family TATA-box binding protein [Sediminibacillus albus]SDK14959.1 TATA-box binding [Sediminibacillus albus]